MSAIPEDAQRLADRLRSLADEVESAARYGVPIPFGVNVSGHQYGTASFHATEAEFDAWADYTEATVEHYEYNGAAWSRASVDCNGLPLEFSTQHPKAAADRVLGGEVAL